MNAHIINPPESCSKCKFLERKTSDTGMHYYTCQIADWTCPVSHYEIIADKFKPFECPF